MGASPAVSQPIRNDFATGGSSGLSFAIMGSRGYPSTYGGYETLVRHLAPFLVDQGHHVTVYCRERRDGAKVWLQDGVRCVATRGTETKSLSTLSFGATATVDAAFRRFDAALVLNVANGFWLPALRAAGVPFAVNTDGLEWKRDKWSRLGKAVFKTGANLSARFAPELVCDSQALGAIWQADFGRSSVFIPYGAEEREHLGSHRIAELGLETGGYVLSVARLAPENNVELMLDAIELLGGGAPPVVVVGSANFDNPITARLERLQDAGRLLWLGHVADQELLAELWQNAGAYVHGHSVGGTNPALLQALGAGAPTLALDTVFNREVLQYDEHLFPHDAQALAARIETLCASPMLQRSLSDSGRAAVAGRYTWPGVCQSYADLLVRLARATATVG